MDDETAQALLQIDWGDIWDTLPEPLSPDRRRTLRNEQDIARGRHPATKVPLLKPEGRRCRDCAHAIAHSHDKTYWKCNLVPITFSAATDIRLKWPACEKFDAK